MIEEPVLTRRGLFGGIAAAGVISAAPEPPAVTSLLHIQVGEGIAVDPKDIEKVVKGIALALKQGGDVAIITGHDVTLTKHDVTGLNAIVAIQKEAEDDDDAPMGNRISRAILVDTRVR